MSRMTLTGAGVVLAAGGGATSTWNPSDKSANITLSNGNLTATATTAAFSSVRGTTSHASGKFYFEFSTTGLGLAAVNCLIGIGTSGAALGSYVGSDTFGVGWYSQDGHVLNNGATVVNGDWWPAVGGLVEAVAVDFGAHLLWVYDANQGRWNGSPTADPATGTEGASFTAGTYFPMGTCNASVTDPNLTINVGGSAFAHTPPSGFSAWG